MTQEVRPDWHCRYKVTVHWPDFFDPAIETHGDTPFFREVVDFRFPRRI